MTVDEFRNLVTVFLVVDQPLFYMARDSRNAKLITDTEATNRKSWVLI